MFEQNKVADCMSNNFKYAYTKRLNKKPKSNHKLDTTYNAYYEEVN